MVLRRSARSVATTVMGSALCAFALVACGSGSDPVNLVDVTAVDPGVDCSNGGIQVDSGADDNGNGMLDEGEVDGTDLVCNSVADALSRTTTLFAGNENCSDGGTMIELGYDNGEGGGTAADGTLDDGEVDSTYYSCAANQLLGGGSIIPPEGPPGAFTMNSSGGNGSDGSGGDASAIDIEIDDASAGGHIKVFSTGVANANFAFPSSVGTFLGDNPLVATADMTVFAVASGSEGTSLSAGDYFTNTKGAGTCNGSNVTPTSGVFVELWDGAASTVVTGVQVNAGVTLTFEPNCNTDHNSAGELDVAMIVLENDVRNLGTITTETLADTRSHAGFSAKMDVYYGGPSSSIDTSGDDATAGSDGGRGGLVYLRTEEDDFSIEGDDGENGGFFNEGTIDTSGGDGDDGGTAGFFRVYAGARIMNTGDIMADGGRGNVDQGGDGSRSDIGGWQDLWFEVNSGVLANSGSISTNGGSGAVGGGDSGQMDIRTDYWGQILNSGDLSARGGDADAACTVGCFGGGGDEIHFDLDGGAIVNSGNITTRGGSGAAGGGGNGGRIDINADEEDGWEGGDVALEDIEFSGNLDARGGDGDSGGDGGSIDFEIDHDDSPAGGELIFYGYTDLIARGGDGADGSGGDGDQIDIEQENGSSGDTLDYTPTGGVVNYANLDTSGGDGLNGDGGDAGYLRLWVDEQYNFISDGAILINNGNVVATGGEGTEGDGGNGGYIEMFAWVSVENNGTIDVSGGDTNTDDYDGGDAADNEYIYLSAASEFLTNTGTITANGGAGLGDGSGGDCGHVEMAAPVVTNSGNISLDGGDADATDGFGGDSDQVLMVSFAGDTSNTGTISVSGGAADTPGDDGQVFIDGMSATP